MFRNFFNAYHTFSDDERLLKQKVNTVVTLTFITSLALFVMSIIRFGQGNIVQGYADLIFVIVFVGSYVLLTRKKSYYDFVSRLLLFVGMTVFVIVLNTAHEYNQTRELWIGVLLITTFFFRDKKEGIAIVVTLTLILISIHLYDQNIFKFTHVDFFILFINIILISGGMIWYEILKETQEKVLSREIEEKNRLNESLELRINERTLELQQEKEKFESLVTDIDDRYIVFKNNLDLNILYVSGGTEKIFGLNPEKMIGKKWDTFINWHHNDIEKFKEKLMKIHSGETNRFETEIRYVHTDGSEHVIMSIAHGVKDHNNILVGFEGILEDITERRKYEEDILSAKEVAESAARVKSEFLSNMSHEIRTPMNAIIGMTQLALKEDLNEKSKNYVKKVNTAAENLLGIINDILDFSKIEAGKLELHNVHFNLVDVIKNSLHLVSVAVEAKGIHTKIKLSPEVLGYYFADSLRLGQVLTNLLSNAVKFSHKESDVILEVSLVGQEDNRAELQFSVIDTGIGISQENQKKLFQSFSQTDSSITKKFGGTGLGLAISKNIVEMMDGDIWVDSVEGEGSSFNFRIKLELSHASNLINAEEHRGENDDAANLRGLKLLLVEDNAFNQELIIELLRTEEVDVTVANNGQEALDILQNQSFDGVLMDIQMPVMDGYEATRRIREQKEYKELPIIALTANVTEDDINKATEAGMNDHIGKPFDPKQMFTIIGKWCKQA